MMKNTPRELNLALWHGIGTEDDAIIPSKAKELSLLCSAFMKKNIDAPWVQPYRLTDKKGRPTKSVDAIVAQRWVEELPAFLRSEVERGHVLEFRVDKKGTRGYALMPAGRTSGDIQKLVDQTDEIARTIESVRQKVSQLLQHPQSESPVYTMDATRKLRDAYGQLDESGRGYVPIHRLRHALDVPREVFDELIRGLRRDLTIDLQVGSPSDYHADEVMNSLMESDGTLYLTISWRKP